MAAMNTVALNDPQLFRDQCLIDGAWLGADGVRLNVTNPADQQIIGTVPDAGALLTRAAVDAATKAFVLWRRTPADERARLLEAWHDLILDNTEDLALLLTLEQGKPLNEARSEIAYGASFIKWFAEEARRFNGSVLPSPGTDRRILVLKEPVGISAIITPWNFPNAMITRKVAPALAAGCTTVIKPSELTPYSALALGELAQRAGIPSGVINIVTGLPGPIGTELLTNEQVRKISFTGSTKVGSLLMRGAAESIKRLSLELGGNAPFIVFDDANLDAAVEGVVASKFRNGGQTCVCANRILVHSSVYDSFASKLAERVATMRVGPGTDPQVQIGPMITSAAVDKIRRHVADALERGAKILVTGSQVSHGAQYVAPLVLVEANADMLLAKEETFGPVAPLFRFETEDEAVALANATPFGLAAYYYTENQSRSWRVAAALDFGMIGLNTGAISTAIAPFGGVKQSGMGREGGQTGIDEYLELKSWHIGQLN